MEIIFLNTLNGKLREPISEFLTQHARETDVFCFQEAFSVGYNMQSICAHLIPDYHVTTAVKETAEDCFAQATYIHPRLRLIETTTIFEEDPQLGIGILSVIETPQGLLTLLNFHGRSLPGTKIDTPLRMQQSEKIIRILEEMPRRRIIGGDFNYDMTTQSLQLLEIAGYTNLIRTCNVRTTRNRIAWEKYPQSPQLHCDYVLVSKEIQVRKLTVPEIEVSDHLPIKVSVD